MGRFFSFPQLFEGRVRNDSMVHLFFWSDSVDDLLSVRASGIYFWLHIWELTRFFFSSWLPLSQCLCAMLIKKAVGAD